MLTLVGFVVKNTQASEGKSRFKQNSSHHVSTLSYKAVYL